MHGLCQWKVLCGSRSFVHNPHILRGRNVHFHWRHTDRRRRLRGLCGGQVFDRRRDVVHQLCVRLLYGVYKTGGMLELPYVRRRKLSDSRLYYDS